MLAPVPVHSLATATKPETTVMDTAGGAATRTLYTDSCLSNIHALHFSTHTKKYILIKMHMT